jgi:predicted ATPase/DNA-binding CsgD family transcriptional regulator
MESVGTGAGVDAEISPRERDVLALLGEHLTNAEIAQQLHLSVRTVESHVSSLLRKLGADDRRALAARASETAAAGARAGRFAGAPVVSTSFVGRSGEREDVRRALAESRLVTLVGPGGVGKTRLALAVVDGAAPSLSGGATFVDLVPVRTHLAQAVAAALEIRERSGQPLEDTLFEQLRGRRSLLVFDNCEHVLDLVAPFVDRLLAACAEVIVLTTSRERLGVPGERIVNVPPLSLDGDDNGRGGASDAVQLFLERARAVDETFDAETNAVMELCTRLDGMPLAIELAAARSASLGVAGLLDGLDDHLQLLTGGRQDAARHRSLRAVIEWSHDLLDEDERAVFRRLAVFVGGFDLEAAAAVAGGDPVRPGAVGDVVGRLVDKNLVVRRRAAPGDRWRLLEIVRAYALERLVEDDDEDEIRSRHVSWAAATARDLAAHIGEAGTWEAEFDAVVDDLRVALDADAPAPDGQAAAYPLAYAVGRLMYARHFGVEAQERFEDAAARARDDRDAAVALRSAANVAFARMRSDIGYPLFIAAADRFAAAGDAAAAAITYAEAVVDSHRFIGEFPTWVGEDAGRALLARASAIAPTDDLRVRVALLGAEAWLTPDERAVGDHDAAVAAVEASRALGDPLWLSNALDALATALMTAGALRDSATCTFERLDLIAQLDGTEPRAGGEITDTYHMAMETAVSIGDLRRARHVADLVARDDVGQTVKFLTASRKVIPLAFMGEFDAALAESDEMHEAWRRAGQPAARWMAPAACATALIHGLRGNRDRYESWYEYARGLSPNISGLAPFVAARVALHEGRLDDAAAALRSVDRITEFFDPYGLSLRAEVAVRGDAGDAEERLERAALAAAQNDWAAACVARAQGLHAGRTDRLEEALTGFDRIGARFEWAITAVLHGGAVARDGRAVLEELRVPFDG